MRRVLSVATGGIVALAVAAAPAGAKKAYFDVKISARQDVTWTRNITVQGCSDSIVVLTGKGEAHLKVHQAANPWVVAETTGDARGATLLFAGESPGARVAGTFSRNGELGGSTMKPPKDPSGCPKSIPTTPDCGTRAVPADAQIYMTYATPATWSYGKPVPKKPSIVVSGPYIKEWTASPFTWCPGVNGDSWLGATWYSNGPAYTGPVVLPLSTLFGTHKHFALSWSDTRTVETARVGGGVVSGTFPVTTKIRWTIRFTRRAKAPGGLGTPKDPPSLAPVTGY